MTIIIFSAMQQKTIIYCLFLLLPFFGFAQHNIFEDHTREIAASESKYFHNVQTEKSEKTGGEIDMVYSRFLWEIDPEVLFIKGCVNSYFISKVPQLSEIHLE
ncbi:MAG: hypothetical protein K9H16_13970, partial [Bacteroidales bacterium]|nr:hypothetical protein [Bacteroidales bacterium]